MNLKFRKGWRGWIDFAGFVLLFGPLVLADKIWNAIKRPFRAIKDWWHDDDKFK